MMRSTIARALISLLIITSVGVSVSACRHSMSGAKQDIKNDTR